MIQTLARTSTARSIPRARRCYPTMRSLLLWFRYGAGLRQSKVSWITSSCVNRNLRNIWRWPISFTLAIVGETLMPVGVSHWLASLNRNLLHYSYDILPNATNANYFNKSYCKSLVGNVAFLSIQFLCLLPRFRLIIEELVCKTAYRPYHMLLISDQEFFFLKKNLRKLFIYPNY